MSADNFFGLDRSGGINRVIHKPTLGERVRLFMRRIRDAVREALE